MRPPDRAGDALSRYLPPLRNIRNKRATSANGEDASVTVTDVAVTGLQTQLSDQGCYAVTDVTALRPDIAESGADR